jgi:hypothetical protein
MKSWLYSSGARYDKVKIINFYGIKDYRGGIAAKSIQVFLYIIAIYIERLNYCVYSQILVNYLGISQRKLNM